MVIIYQDKSRETYMQNNNIFFKINSEDSIIKIKSIKIVVNKVQAQK